MKYIICDITGRTINYDVALCDAIYRELPKCTDLRFWSSGLSETHPYAVHKFHSVVPKKKKTKSNKSVRILKAFDSIFAYIWIILYFLFKKVRVFHLQWFPFLSLGLSGSIIDISFIKLLRFISPKTKYVFTIHNVCPHGMKQEDLIAYNKVFSKALNLFDDYVVHTESTKKYVVSMLGLNANDVHVIYHGIFAPNNYKFAPNILAKNKLKIIMYGFQSYYKGTDILLKALSLVDNAYKDKLEVIICGAFSDDYYKECKSIITGVSIKWIPRFVPDVELYDNINASNIIVLPYRKISQSGVLLLALSTRRYIITSNLPSFKETLKGFPDNTFFKSEDAADFADKP